MPIDPQQLVRTLVAQQTPLLAYIWSIVRDEDLAEDVYQDVAADAVAKCNTIHDTEHLTRWLRQAARYRAIDLLRARKGKALVFDTGVLDALESDWDSRTALDAREVRRSLKHCMEQLSPYVRKIIELRYSQDLTGEALAEAMGKPKNTVYTALSRAHRTLGDCVRKQMNGEDTDV